MTEKRRMKAFGRSELASPVAEALRRCTEDVVVDKCCLNCEYFKEETGDGYPLNWCDLNNTSTESEDYCDEFQRI
ncbi:MAG: hypothetical protein ACE5J5_07320 [Candidatus Hydrothermarchaeales archaeon]